MVDVRTASRAALLTVIARQQQEILGLQRTVADQQAEIVRLTATVAEQQLTIARLEARVRDLEAGGGPGGPRGMPGLKLTQSPAERPERARKRRARGFGRARGTPTDVVVHALEECPDCGTALQGGTPKRSRQVVEVAPSPADVVEHIYVERTCPRCHRRWTPTVDLQGVVADQQRLGVGLVSLVAMLREAGRLPVRTVQWYLEQVHGLHLSAGAIVAASRRVSAHGAAELARIRERVRASPAVHADETGWRQQGRNGYVWTFSTPAAVLFQYGRRTKGMVDQVLDETFSGVLVSDFYAAYHHYPGLHQRCWAHLLREIHDLRTEHPHDQALGRWAAAVQDVYARARACSDADPRARVRAMRRFEAELLAVCRPSLAKAGAPQRTLCERIGRHLSELFVFVAFPEVPPDNNAAERSLRHLVTSRKISGGTRSEPGTATKMTNASLFGTWALQGLEPLAQCRRLLASPQL
ncbi:MAG TPA: IS66 family transposase [Candidatus Binatia bacterium]|nr:IS66 family transposase [Candidatus Binatia bacterium]